MKICCFGEILLRLSPDDEFLKNNMMPFFVGGAELNVATALATWNVPVKYITAAPQNFLSKEIINAISKKNIDCNEIIYTGERIGIYYLPVGGELKNLGVVYDRNYSSFSQLKPGIINWDRILDDCDWFHFSAISAALNFEIAEVCKEALEVASAKGLTISVDLNYRNKLWQYGKQPVEVMPTLLKFCHVVMGNIWSAESLLGISSSISNSSGKTKEELIAAAEQSFAIIQKNFPRVNTMAFTFRLDENYWAIMQNELSVAVSEEYPIVHVVDKVGSGDCFMAGIIYGLKNHFSVKKIVDFASAAAVGKLGEAGDVTHQTIESIMYKSKNRLL